MRVLSSVAVVFFLCTTIWLAVPSRAAAEGPLWFHLEVVVLGSDSETVKVNLPMKLLKAMLPHLRAQYLSEETFRMHGGLTEAELRDILSSVREAEDGSTIEVETNDRRVRAVRQKDVVEVEVVARRTSDEAVRLRIHEQVLDGLLAGEPGEIDVTTALERIGSDRTGGLPSGDLVTVTNDLNRVRIWVDGNSTID
jgi:hypothetical protein